MWKMTDNSNPYGSYPPPDYSGYSGYQGYPDAGANAAWMYPVNGNQPQQYYMFVPRPEVGLWTAYRLFWKNGLNFSGRASRSEYWFAFLANFLLSFVFTMLLSGLGLLIFMTEFGAFSNSQPTGETVLLFILLGIGLLYGFASVLPNIAVTIRRFHDADLSGALILLQLVPGVGKLIGFLGISMSGAYRSDSNVGSGLLTSVGMLLTLGSWIAIIVLLARPSNLYGAYREDPRHLPEVA
jgi:uncharacterized membrane protein YhaH (DUF805 family)